MMWTYAVVDVESVCTDMDLDVAKCLMPRVLFDTRELAQVAAVSDLMESVEGLFYGDEDEDADVDKKNLVLALLSMAWEDEWPGDGMCCASLTPPGWANPTHILMVFPMVKAENAG